MYRFYIPTPDGNIGAFWGHNVHVRRDKLSSVQVRMSALDTVTQICPTRWRKLQSRSSSFAGIFRECGNFTLLAGRFCVVKYGGYFKISIQILLSRVTQEIYTKQMLKI